MTEINRYTIINYHNQKEDTLLNEDILSRLTVEKVYSITSMYTEANKTFKRKNRPQWAIVIKYEGETLYKSKGVSYTSNMNNIIILPKGCFYEWHCTKAGHFYTLEFECPLTYDGIFAFQLKNSEKLLNLFKQLEYTRTAKLPMYEMKNIRDTYSALLMLTESIHKPYIPDSRYQKLLPAMEYITNNYTTTITNDALAQLTGLSTVYFRKLFFEMNGVSPITYVHDLRIKKAQEMLISDHGSITDIALSLGYNNIYEFSKAFKNHTGVSPKKYSTTK